ncbi:helix-turn-helix domain-containing protein [Thermococcus sp.]|uniref:GbsR/MarR family transcriptional regulator n=1 Tax=Thermococcus sp. TaxID=35749 RepID=UPI0026351BBB|nr:helix-turn-helix domain-containing protein [Thermococcus sp.]
MESEESPEFYVEKILESFGYPPAPARIYAQLLFSEKPKTITELARETGLGKSTVSTALRLLEHDGLVYSTKMGKKKLYHARSAFNRLLMFPERILKEYVVPLRKLLEQNPNENEKILKDVREFEELAKAILKLLDEFSKTNTS